MQKRRLYLVTNDYPNSGGDANFIRYEVLRLREEFDVVNICLSGKSKSAADCAENTYFLGYGAKVILKYLPGFLFDSLCRCERKVIRQSTKSISLRIRRMISSARVYAGSEWFNGKIKDILKDAPADSVVYTYWNDYSMLGFLRNKDKHPDFRYVSRIHGCDLYDERVPSMRQPFKWFMNDKVDKLVFIGQNSMDYYLEHHPELPKEKYDLCRLGVEPSKDMTVAPSDEFLMVSCSRIIPLKRINLITEALSKISCDFPVRWVHFGDGELFESEKANTEKLLAGKTGITCEFKGNADNEAVRDYYASNEIGCFITTSSTEGCPVSVMEAMAAGIPVIGTAVGDIPFMIDESGVLLNANPSSEEVADAIENLVRAFANRRTTGDFADMCINSKKLYNKMFNVAVNTEYFITNILMDKR